MFNTNQNPTFRAIFIFISFEDIWNKIEKVKRVTITAQMAPSTSFKYPLENTVCFLLQVNH